MKKNEKKGKKKKINKKKNETKYVISIYLVDIISFPHVQRGFFFSVKCQNSEFDLIQCYCEKCAFLSAYECQQNYICIHIITYLS